MSHFGSDMMMNIELRVLKETNSDLLTEKYRLEAEVASLKFELEKLGVNPDHAKYVQQTLEQRTAEIRFSEEKIASLERTIRKLIDETKEHQDSAEKARLIAAGLQEPIRTLMRETMDQKERDERVKNYVAAFVLGCIASLLASWLYAYLTASA